MNHKKTKKKKEVSRPRPKNVSLPPLLSLPTGPPSVSPPSPLEAHSPLDRSTLGPRSFRSPFPFSHLHQVPYTILGGSPKSLRKRNFFRSMDPCVLAPRAVRMGSISASVRTISSNAGCLGMLCSESYASCMIELPEESWGNLESSRWL
jgi:hypothetical protein